MYKPVGKKPYTEHQWRMARKGFLSQHPLCERCQREGITKVADVVNHRIPHKGNEQLFWDPGNWEAVCKWHHDSVIQREERSGRKTVITGADGWPIE
jgi:5-methylcytosine-specific restriction enzyme A